MPATGTTVAGLVAVYLVAAVAAVWVASAPQTAALFNSLPDTWVASGPAASRLASLLTADVVATLVVFASSVATRNSSMYDPYWSVAPIVLVAGVSQLPEAAAAGVGGPAIRRVLQLLLIALWGVRLTCNWFIGWSGLGHEDWRYCDLRAGPGGGGGLRWQLINLAGIHLFPTVVVFLCCIGVYAAAIGTAPLGWGDAVGAGVTLCGTLVQAVSDTQMRTRRRPGAVMDYGLWSLSRHPNYVGEWMVWLGVALIGVAAKAPGLSNFAICAGQGICLGMFLYVSVPLMEDRQLDRRGSDYRNYMCRVAPFWPYVFYDA